MNLTVEKRFPLSLYSSWKQEVEIKSNQVKNFQRFYFFQSTKTVYTIYNNFIQNIRFFKFLNIFKTVLKTQ